MGTVYHVLTAIVNEQLKTALVSDAEFDIKEKADYFVYGAQDVFYHGKVTIEGPAAHMVPDSLVEG